MLALGVYRVEGSGVDLGFRYKTEAGASETLDIEKGCTE